MVLDRQPQQPGEHRRLAHRHDRPAILEELLQLRQGLSGGDRAELSAYSAGIF